MTARTTRWIMVAIAVLSVVVAVAIPGYQTWLVIFGGVLIAWASFRVAHRAVARARRHPKRAHSNQRPWDQKS